MTLKTLAFVLGAVIGIAGATPGGARAADNVRVRGTVSKFDGSTLTVKTSTSTPKGTYPVTMIANSGKYTRTATVGVVVQ